MSGTAEVEASHPVPHLTPPKNNGTLNDARGRAGARSEVETSEARCFRGQQTSEARCFRGKQTEAVGSGSTEVEANHPVPHLTPPKNNGTVNDA